MENNAVALRPEQPMEMAVADLEAQIRKIQTIMRAVMQDGQHYGVIPGTDKPTLLKPGAEKLAMVFRLAPSFKIIRNDLPGNHREFEVICTLTHIPTGQLMAEGVGSCSTMESKYRWRRGEAEKTDNVVPPAYWNMRKTNPAKAQEVLGGKGFVTIKIDNVWWIAKKSDERIENTDIADTYNTVLKMAKKRAQVDATLTATAASDIFTQDVGEDELETGFDKAEWQREHRKEFKQENGYSEASHYATGGLRKEVLTRDGYKCVACGMTDEDHKLKWDRPITIDHMDKDKKNNTLENLQTLCLICHGKKDQSPELKIQEVPKFKDQILKARAEGKTYQKIADEVGFSIASIWKWVQVWSSETKTVTAAQLGAAILEHTNQDRKAADQILQNLIGRANPGKLSPTEATKAYKQFEDIYLNVAPPVDDDLPYEKWESANELK